MPYADLAKRREAQARECPPKAKPGTPAGGHSRAGPGLCSGRAMLTEAGPVASGQPVDVSSWSADALRLALATDQIRIPPAPGRSTYVAVRRLKLSDRWVEPGEPIPEADYWPIAGPWLRSEMIAVDPFRFTPIATS